MIRKVSRKSEKAPRWVEQERKGLQRSTVLEDQQPTTSHALDQSSINSQNNEHNFVSYC